MVEQKRRECLRNFYLFAGACICLFAVSLSLLLVFPRVMDFLFGDIKDGRVAFALLFSPPSAAGFMAWRQIVIYKATVKKMLMDDIMSFGEIFTYYDSSDIRKEIYSYPFLEKSQLFSEFKYVNYDESWISARDGVLIKTPDGEKMFIRSTEKDELIY